ncbi:MAG: hypothetical protein AAFR61_09300 [Bacteroidota bacterium]
MKPLLVLILASSLSTSLTAQVSAFENVRIPSAMQDRSGGASMLSFIPGEHQILHFGEEEGNYFWEMHQQDEVQRLVLAVGEKRPAPPISFFRLPRRTSPLVMLTPYQHGEEMGVWIHTWDGDSLRTVGELPVANAELGFPEPITPFVRIITDGKLWEFRFVGPVFLHPGTPHQEALKPESILYRYEGGQLNLVRL